MRVRATRRGLGVGGCALALALAALGGCSETMSGPYGGAYGYGHGAYGYYGGYAYSPAQHEYWAPNYEPGVYAPTSASGGGPVFVGPTSHELHMREKHLQHEMERQERRARAHATQ